MAGKQAAAVILRHALWDGKSGELEMWKARADKKLASTTFANNVHMISVLIKFVEHFKTMMVIHFFTGLSHLKSASNFLLSLLHQ